MPLPICACQPALHFLLEWPAAHHFSRCTGVLSFVSCWHLQRRMFALISFVHVLVCTCTIMLLLSWTPGYFLLQCLKRSGLLTL